MHPISVHDVGVEERQEDEDGAHQDRDRPLATSPLRPVYDCQSRARTNKQLEEALQGISNEHVVK